VCLGVHSSLSVAARHSSLDLFSIGRMATPTFTESINYKKKVNYCKLRPHFGAKKASKRPKGPQRFVHKPLCIGPSIPCMKIGKLSSKRPFLEPKGPKGPQTFVHKGLCTNLCALFCPLCCPLFRPLDHCTVQSHKEIKQRFVATEFTPTPPVTL